MFYCNNVPSSTPVPGTDLNLTPDDLSDSRVSEGTEGSTEELSDNEESGHNDVGHAATLIATSPSLLSPDVPDISELSSSEVSEEDTGDDIDIYLSEIDATVGLGTSQPPDQTEDSI